jgi:glycosyltransferase involved in cell wall biosynthesis
MAKSHAVIISFADETASSGQMVFLHALQMGKPVIVTRSSCLQGYVEDGSTGLIIDKVDAQLDDAMNILRHGAKYQEISEMQRETYSTRFGFDAMAQKLAGMIDAQKAA